MGNWKLQQKDKAVRRYQGELGGSRRGMSEGSVCGCLECSFPSSRLCWRIRTLPVDESETSVVLRWTE